MRERVVPTKTLLQQNAAKEAPKPCGEFGGAACWRCIALGRLLRGSLEKGRFASNRAS